jgi:hypothetical protein
MADGHLVVSTRNPRYFTAAPEGSGLAVYLTA